MGKLGLLRLSPVEPLVAGHLYPRLLETLITSSLPSMSGLTEEQQSLLRLLMPSHSSQPTRPSCVRTLQGRVILLRGKKNSHYSGSVSLQLMLHSSGHWEGDGLLSTAGAPMVVKPHKPDRQGKGRHDGQSHRPGGILQGYAGLYPIVLQSEKEGGPPALPSTGAHGTFP